MSQFEFCPLCAARLEPKPSDPDLGRPWCPAGHFIHYDNPACTVQGWIERDGKYLLLKRNIEPKLGEWDLPGGFVEMGETPIEAVLREVHEETGLKVAITGLIGAFSSEYIPGKWTIDIAYTCEVSGGEFVLDEEESQDSDWFAPEDMPELAFPGEREALAALLA